MKHSQSQTYPFTNCCGQNGYPKSRRVSSLLKIHDRSLKIIVVNKTSTKKTEETLSTRTSETASIDVQLFRERLSEKMCKRQSRKVVWDMINTPFLPTLQQLSNLLLLLSFSTSKHMAYGLWPLVPLFQISLKNSELKTTHNTFRDCRVRFFGQPFSKQLYNPHPYPLHHQGQTADTGYGLRNFNVLYMALIQLIDLLKATRF